MLPVVPIT
ncbi:unnamed protein product, partial [Rotaria sp. Silwood1]